MCARVRVQSRDIGICMYACGLFVGKAKLGQGVWAGGRGEPEEEGGKAGGVASEEV